MIGAGKLVDLLRKLSRTRPIDQAVNRADRVYRPSLHLVGSVAPSVAQVPNITRNPWFILLVLAAVYSAGYISADDERVDAANACARSRSQS